jgi:hypothetical protein
MGKIPYWASANIKRHHTKYTRYDDLAPRICVSLLYIIKINHTVEYVS